jgi:heparan-alpha-glucosaminide N-acetyltransferase
VAIPFSYGRREAQGHSYGRMFGHALWRSVVLVLLSVFLVSVDSPRTNFLFTNVLAQIGLGYLFVFLLWRRGAKAQVAAVVAIFVGYWLLFYFGRTPDPGPEAYENAGKLLKDCSPMTGLAGHWNKCANFAAWFDQWFLNLFPRPAEFVFEPGGYQTLNFIPSMATMIFGLMAGEMLCSERTAKAKLSILAVAGLVLLTLGLMADWTDVCPIVKRIWSPSWALFSGGVVMWGLAVFYATTDMAGRRRWAMPLVVVGMNSLAIYCMVHLLRPWTWQMIRVHCGPPVEWLSEKAAARGLAFDPVYLPIVEHLSILFAFWLVLCWMYRQRLFVRV